MLEEKEALSEKLAISEYEFRLAQEDITRLKTEGQKRSDCSIDKLKGIYLYTELFVLLSLLIIHPLVR